MAIQNISDNDDQGTGMIKKSVHVHSANLINQTLQVNQYQQPYESTIRELTSNAVDAVQEKLIAIDILQGKAKVEDYYIIRENDEEEYKDSKFDPSYYDEKWLDLDNNEVTIHYKENPGSLYCDDLIFTDYGCGASPTRMLNMIGKLGYSTKRNNNFTKGSFGLGGKVGLSSRTKSYFTTCYYNGYIYEFEIFNSSFKSLVPKFNDDGTANEEFVLGQTDEGEDIKIFRQKTESKNKTIVRIPSMRVFKSKYLAAAKKQLLYFDGVKYTEEDEGGYQITHDLKADIIYESDNIIVSNNSQYSKPHIVIVPPQGTVRGAYRVNPVCYGHILFEELDLPIMSGNVALKVCIKSSVFNEFNEEEILNHGVSVTPSRESIIYAGDPDTKFYLEKKFKDIVDEASKIATDTLNSYSKDVVTWIKGYSSIMHAMSKKGKTDTLLDRIAGLILDKSIINPSYDIPGVGKVTFDQIHSIISSCLRSYTIQWDKPAKLDIGNNKQVEETFSRSSFKGDVFAAYGMAALENGYAVYDWKDILPVKRSGASSLPIRKGVLVHSILYNDYSEATTLYWSETAFEDLKYRVAREAHIIPNRTYPEPSKKKLKTLTKWYNQMTAVAEYLYKDIASIMEYEQEGATSLIEELGDTDISNLDSKLNSLFTHKKESTIKLVKEEKERKRVRIAPLRQAGEIPIRLPHSSYTTFRERWEIGPYFTDMGYPGLTHKTYSIKAECLAEHSKSLGYYSGNIKEEMYVATLIAHFVGESTAAITSADTTKTKVHPNLSPLLIPSAPSVKVTYNTEKQCTDISTLELTTVDSIEKAKKPIPIALSDANVSLIKSEFNHIIYKMFDIVDGVVLRLSDQVKHQMAAYYFWKKAHEKGARGTIDLMKFLDLDNETNELLRRVTTEYTLGGWAHTSIRYNFQVFKNIYDGFLQAYSMLSTYDFENESDTPMSKGYIRAIFGDKFADKYPDVLTIDIWPSIDTKKDIDDLIQKAYDLDISFLVHNSGMHESDNGMGTSTYDAYAMETSHVIFETYEDHINLLSKHLFGFSLKRSLETWSDPEIQRLCKEGSFVIDSYKSEQCQKFMYSFLALKRIADFLNISINDQL